MEVGSLSLHSLINRGRAEKMDHYQRRELNALAPRSARGVMMNHASLLEFGILGLWEEGYQD